METAHVYVPHMLEIPDEITDEIPDLYSSHIVLHLQ